MERIKIMFLTFVLSLSSISGTACWYDWDDDWDDYDDYYDNGEWYDIGWMFDDDEDDYDDVDDIDDDEYEEDDDIDDDGGDDDIINGPELDNVDVIGSYGDDDNNNDDWEDDDFGWFDEEEDYNDNDNGSHDNHQQTDNIDYTIPVELKETFEKLPEGVKNLLMENGVKIFYAPSYRSPDGGYDSYNPENKSIIVSSLEVDDLLREAIHAAQDVLGIMDLTSRSAEEFQEKALGDLRVYYDIMFCEKEGRGYRLDASYDGESGWYGFLERSFVGDGVLNRSFFIENIMSFFDIFQECYKNTPGYNDPLEDDYKWNWNFFFNLLGF